MKGRKKQLLAAKNMFKESLSAGSVDPDKVRQILKKIISQKPTHLANILKVYKRLIESKLAQEQIIIETATEFPNQSELERKLIKKTGAKRVFARTNPKIVFGARIIHGDWIWDATLDAKLKQLTINI